MNNNTEDLKLFEDYELVFELIERSYNFAEDLSDNDLISEVSLRSLSDVLLASTEEIILAERIIDEVNCGKIDMNKMYNLLEQLTGKLVIRK